MACSTVPETKWLQQLKLTVSPLTVLLLYFCLVTPKGRSGRMLFHLELLSDGSIFKVGFSKGNAVLLSL